jgi:ABC-2 type transport system permease protein
MMGTLRIVRYSVLAGAYDYMSIYTWRSWLGGWFVRALAQVTFFALIGRLLGAEQQTWFLLVGNAVMLAAMEGIFALNMVSWERNTGTLPLLAASPTSPVLVLASRGVYLIGDGTVSAVGALFVLGPVFGLPLPWPHVLLVIPLTVLVGASAYCLGTFLGGVVLGFRGLNSLVVNVGIVAVMALCGINVPLDAYPEPIAWIARFLPVTHGLIAVRDVLAGDLAGAAIHALAELGIAFCWLGLCVLTFGRFVQRGRRNGSLEYAT